MNTKAVFTYQKKFWNKFGDMAINEHSLFFAFYKSLPNPNPIKQIFQKLLCLQITTATKNRQRGLEKPFFWIQCGRKRRNFLINMYSNLRYIYFLKLDQLSSHEFHLMRILAREMKSNDSQRASRSWMQMIDSH